MEGDEDSTKEGIAEIHHETLGQSDTRNALAIAAFLHRNL